MKTYSDEVVVGKKLILDNGASEKAIKTELYASFLDGFDNCVSEIISDMTEAFSDQKQREAFEDMVERDIQTYMKFLEINQDSRDIEAHEDPHFYRVSFEASFDEEKAMKKAEKAFKQLNQQVSR